jgi:hypothetical protein
MLRAVGLLAAFANAEAAVRNHCGAITSDETWSLADDHVLSCQTFVKDGATLTIEAGVTVYAEAIDSNYDVSVVTACTEALCTTANSCIYISASVRHKFRQLFAPLLSLTGAAAAAAADLQAVHHCARC